MQFEITFADLPAGFAVNSVRKGEQVHVCMQEFVSSEDGDKLIGRLEGVSECILSRLPAQIHPSSIDHLLAIIRPDKTATVYINELEFIAQMRPRRSVKKGEVVFQKDILDINRVTIRDIPIPAGTGFMIVLSIGWRKGLYYDLSPLHVPEHPERDYDVELLLGRFWSYLTFQDLFKIEETTWSELFRQRWFPFIYMGYPLLQKMLARGRAGFDIDELLPEIKAEIDKLVVEAGSIWRSNPYFKAHVPVLERAIERYQAEDHVSATAILYPRIEGAMRSYLSSAGLAVKPTASNLAREIVAKDAAKRHSCCLFLPDKFRKYLDEVYFAAFQPGSNPNVSRHSVAHGEAKAEDFSLKTAVIGILTLYQIALFLSADSGTPKDVGSV